MLVLIHIRNWQWACSSPLSRYYFWALPTLIFSRRLRQASLPPFPFLFTFLMEHLTQCLNEKAVMGKLQLFNLKGVSVLSQLMHAELQMMRWLFFKATKRSMAALLQSRMHLKSYITPIQAYKLIWKNPIFFCLVVVLTVGLSS